MTENKRYVRILDYSEKEVRIFDKNNQKNIFNIFFEGIDSAICLKGALEDTVDLLNELSEERGQLKQEVESIHSKNIILLEHCDDLQERNDRQADTIRELYNLIEKQDWETLTDRIEELNKAEEQLKIEMRCYE